MPSASLSAAASAAVSTSSTALGVAVTSAYRPPSVDFVLLFTLLPLGLAITLGVQAALGDVLHHAVRDQVPDRLPRLDPGAAVGRGGGQRRYVRQAYLAVGQGRP